ncbi:MAG TPA: DUF5060 domain-containing protein, partial [Candidatus Brocadiia bacterium]|nr:DUF5060 domain-containing protein [Candidatus Brocadiia bacterium]
MIGAARVLWAGLLAAAWALPCLAQGFSFDFETGAEGWAGAPKTVAEIAQAVGRPGRAMALRPAGENQDSVCLQLRRAMDWRRAGDLSFDVFATPEAGPAQVLLFVRDEDDLWFQTSKCFSVAPGRWVTVTVDASPESIDWETRGHGLPWCGYAIQNLREVGIKVFRDGPLRGPVYVDNARLALAPRKAPPPLALLNYSTNGSVTPLHGLFEITFEINRTYDNPFDPAEVDVRGVFVSPSGMVHEAPGFFYQDYQRQIEANVESLIPSGRPVWKIRYAPAETGNHRYFVEIRENGGKTKRAFFRQAGEQARRWVQCEPSDNPGYVRVSPRDWRCFEFDNGEFFYPIGHNIPATYNVKNAEALGVSVQRYEGTFAYDRFLAGMTQGEENYARVWLASWSFGLEWSRRYSPDYRGLGRYNLRNAWRLDYVMNECARRGIYAQLALTTFGHYRSHTFEGDWPYSPYNKDNGGPIAKPSQFWTSAECQEIYRKMLRYVAARWGYSTHIMAWEISNEIDLVDDYKGMRDHIKKWHQECAATLSQFDQGKHLVTTNFAVWQHDPAILQMPEISYSSTNRYSRGIIEDLKRVYEMKSAYRKPAIMAECGDDFKGSSAQTTETYIPICLWAAYMMPLAGAGTQWWWDFIDDRNLYYYFQGLSRFARGEDRRNQGLVMQTPAVVALPEGKAD